MPELKTSNAWISPAGNAGKPALTVPLTPEIILNSEDSPKAT